MDIQGLYQLLQATFQPDANVRTQAESKLQELESTQGTLLLFMQIIGTQESDMQVRQAASIYFKNAVRRYWYESESAETQTHTISQADKETIKANILQLLVTSPPLVRAQLITVLGTILSSDFPTKFPGYLTMVQNLLQSQDSTTVLVGLIALKEVLRVYKFKTEDREPVDEIIANFFPAIQQIGANLVNSVEAGAAEMLKMIFKCYHYTIQLDLSEHQQNTASLIPWGTLFLQIVEKPVPAENLPTDPEELEKHPWWKAKRWAYRCLNRLYTRYGNPSALTSDSKFMVFAKTFIVNFAPNILTAYLKQVELWVAKTWLSPRVLCLIANFFEECIRPKNIWALMKPHSETLIMHFIFPQLCFTAADEALWLDDPVEYVHSKVDKFEDFTSPSAAAISFLGTMSRYRQNAFMQTLALANTILQKYNETPVEARNPREKDGALVMVGSLASLILRKRSLSSMMEPFFVNHVFAEFKSQHPFLRARACEIVNQFSELDFVDPNNVAIAFTSLMDCLRDEQLPVKVTAALALRPMIRHEAIFEAMKPHLQFVMHELLAMTNEIDVDTLAEVMDEFVEVFAQDLAPFAVQLCEQLRDTFLRICEDMAKGSDGTDELSDAAIDEATDKTMAAMGVLKTMGTLIISLESTPEVLNQLEIALLPVVQFTLQNAIVDLFDGVFEIVDSCTCSGKTISANMWSVFELIYKTFKESALDYIEDMFPALDNYIAFGKDVVSTNENVQHTFYDIIETVMKSDRLGENDRVAGCKLAESLLLHCKGHVDKYLTPILVLVFEHLGPADRIKTVEFRVQAIEVVMGALYYNPAATLRILEENGWTERFLTVWFTNLDKFSRVYDKRLSILTLCSILTVPVEQLPAALRSNWPQVLQGILTNFEGLPAAQAKRKDLERMYNIGSDDEDEADEDDDQAGEGEADVEEEWVDDGEDVFDEGSEYIEYLALQASRNRPADRDEEEEDLYEDDLEEEVYFESPLDDIDPYIHFRDVFKGLQQHNPESYNELTKALTAEQQAFIMTLVVTADANAKKAAESATA
ncbi:armadillo-type protein [Mortierella sp. GBAus27b]|nr:hypothetical protein BGX31_007915 [Mortierella sp. GBA43]KAI8358337.1 armadillo-type protein [Mortierella sp. GBAus27b]